MALAWKAIMFDYNWWFTFIISTDGYINMFMFVLLGYLIVIFLDFRRIKKVPINKVIKNVE